MRFLREQKKTNSTASDFYAQNILEQQSENEKETAKIDSELVDSGIDFRNENSIISINRVENTIVGKRVPVYKQ